MAEKSRVFVKEAVVEEALPGLTFRVRLRDDQREVLAYLGGRMKLHFIKIIPGDHVLLEMTPYDEKKGRIIRRL